MSIADEDGVQMGDLPETTPERSSLMKRVRRSGTTPELIVRQALSRVGARYRTNIKDLPGRPDIANKLRKKAIFVHGCFWHFHEACGRGRIPKQNEEFWREKLLRNTARDRRKVTDLGALGYDVLVLWGCQLQDLSSLEERLRDFWFRDTENEHNSSEVR